MSLFNSKYPAIVIDETNQMPNPHMKKTLTIEEYYDLLHHTHIDIGNGGPMITPTQIEAINTVNERINALEATVSKMAKVIQKLVNNEGVSGTDTEFDFNDLYISVDDNEASINIEDGGQEINDNSNSSVSDNNSSSPSLNNINDDEGENIDDFDFDIDDDSSSITNNTDVNDSNSNNINTENEEPDFILD